MKETEKRPSAVIYVGSTEESVAAARRLIIEIISTNNDPTVKVAALQAAVAICSPKANITGCTFHGI